MSSGPVSDTGYQTGAYGLNGNTRDEALLKNSDFVFGPRFISRFPDPDAGYIHTRKKYLQQTSMPWWAIDPNTDESLLSMRL
ncbi:hypothetical protein CEXT_437501 [Caerostris extrusa]|uniref:Uncharacterized protein n=1 Tax=Caerostris extrusa TaxID=172846 RepID=A0AAV4TBN9_CAEEX|nr:hypothetical protein CEXT_437501 [Caerostris extrusa]